jgi:hypothetical protein
MKHVLTHLFFALFLSAMTCTAGWAQATAQISGAAQDQSGAVLPGVEVTATQTETGISRMTVTNETGHYVLPNLPLGPYKLEAALPGFRTFVQTGIVLNVNANPTINISLQVGQVSEQVEVQANAGLVETRNLSVGNVMETASILDLPLNGRNAQELLLLGGGATQVAPAAGQVFPGRLLISSAGRLGTSTDYTLDGIRHVDTYDGFPLPLPFPDALAEFKTEIGGISANQGQGAQVSAVTKSGTNDIHGDLFEFVRNDLFNARPYFAVKGNTLKRNQFGGTVGGPIIKNKLFFFGGYQGTTLRQDPADQRAFVPTAAMLAGDFTAFASPACNAGRPLALRPPFVNNKIDPSLLDPIALRLASKLPTSTDPCGLVTYGRLQVQNLGQTLAKIDYQASAKHSIFGRFMYSSNDQPSPLKFTPNNILNAATATNSNVYSFTFGSTYLVSSTTVNAFRLAVNRDKSIVSSPPFTDWTELGSKLYSGGYPHVLGIGVGSFFTISAAPAIYVGNLYQIADDVSISRGKHQFGFGGRIAESRTPMTDQSLLAPTFNFSGATTGSAMADFLSGKVNDFNQGTTALNTSRMNYLNLYAQDTWQIRPRLTASYGLRWAPIFPLMDYHRPTPMVWNFDIDRYQKGIRSSVFVNAPPGSLYPGDPGFVQHFNAGSKPEADLWNTYWKGLAPRIGLAWDVRGDGKTSVRASYGITYDEYVANYRLGTSSAQAPWGSFLRVIAPGGGLADPWAGIPNGNPFPFDLARNTVFGSGGDYLPSNPNLTPTYTQSWTLSIQREVVRGTVVSVSYLGTGLRHTQAADMVNPAIYVPGNGDATGSCFLNGQSTYFKVTAGQPCSTIANTQARRKLSLLNPASANEVGRMGIIVNGGTQNYNGMLLSVQRRLDHNLTLNANYTWSHCVGDYAGRSNSGFGTGAAATFQDPNNHHLDRGNCESDQRNSFNLTALAEAPKFGNHILNLLGSGWRLSGLYRIGTSGNVIPGNGATGARTVTLGTPTSSSRTSSGIDICLCDVQNPRPDLVLPNAVYLDKSGRPGTQYLNPAAFGTPKLGTLGNMGRVTLVFPPISQFDAALSRVFKIRESHSIEIRAEAFSVLNNFRAGNMPANSNNTSSIVDVNLNSPTFGKVRYALDPRIMQFAMKYVF